MSCIRHTTALFYQASSNEREANQEARCREVLPGTTGSSAVSATVMASSNNDQAIVLLCVALLAQRFGML
jgi:hypothetical protein